MPLPARLAGDRHQFLDLGTGKIFPGTFTEEFRWLTPRRLDQESLNFPHPAFETAKGPFFLSVFLSY